LVVDPATGGKSLRYGKDSEVVLPDPDGSGGSLGIFATTAALETAHPAASNSGFSAAVGAVAPYAMYVSDGVNWVEAAIADANGDFHANVVHRTGALASLQELVEPVGEIAVATDTPALVAVTAAGGKAVYPGGPGGLPAANPTTGLVGYFPAGTYTVTVGVEFATAQLALNYLKQCLFHPNALVNVACVGHDAVGLSLDDAYLPNVSLVPGVGQYVDGISGTVASQSGTAGNYVVVLNIADANTFIAVNDYFGYANEDELNNLNGCHLITAVTSTQVTISVQHNAPPPATGAFSSAKIFRATIDGSIFIRCTLRSISGIGFPNITFNNSMVLVDSVNIAVLGNLQLADNSNIKIGGLVSSAMIIVENSYLNLGVSTSVGVYWIAYNGELVSGTLISVGNDFASAPAIESQAEGKISIGDAYVFAPVQTTAVVAKASVGLSTINIAGTLTAVGITTPTYDPALQTLGADGSFINKSA
jgi:hypothetical protein